MSVKSMAKTIVLYKRFAQYSVQFLEFGLCMAMNHINSLTLIKPLTCAFKRLIEVIMPSLSYYSL